MVNGDGVRGACRNCAAGLTGPFCAACGQRDQPPDPTLREIAAEAWEAFVNVDGKVVSSVRLLFTRPGVLTAEYLLGHRARYLPPLRLYLVCSVFFFLVTAAMPDRARGRRAAAARDGAPGELKVFTLRRSTGSSATDEGAEAVEDSLQRVQRDSSRRATLASIGRDTTVALDSASRALADSVGIERKLARELGARPGWWKRTFYPRFIRNAPRIVNDKKTFARYMREQTARVMFVLMPVFAGLLALAYRSRRRRYPSHLIVSLHLHAFMFATATLVALAGLLPNGWLRRTPLALLLLWAIAYVPLALRRVYGGRRRMAILRATALAGIYAGVAMLAVTAAAFAVILMY